MGAALPAVFQRISESRKCRLSAEPVLLDRLPVFRYTWNDTTYTELSCVNKWKANRKTAAWAVLALLLTAALLTGCGAPQAGQSLTCTVSISCASILEHMDLCDPEKLELAPEDGWLLEPVEVSFQEGQSAFDVLQQVCRENKLHLEFSTTPVYGSAYIEGIGNLYEFDCGAESGWMYAVNGWFPNYGCSQYALQDGDTVTWVYTCELGRDVGGGDWTEDE